MGPASLSQGLPPWRSPADRSSFEGQAAFLTQATQGLHALDPEAAAPALALRAGEVLHDAGAFTDRVWRVDSGALRLDLVGERRAHFVQLVLSGDHLGWRHSAACRRCTAPPR